MYLLYNCVSFIAFSIVGFTLIGLDTYYSTNVPFIVESIFKVKVILMVFMFAYLAVIVIAIQEERK